MTSVRPRQVSAASAPVSTRGTVPAWWRLAAAASLLFAVGAVTYAWGLHLQLGDARQLLTDQSAREALLLREELVQTRSATVRLPNTLNILSSSDMIRVDLTSSAPASTATGRACVSAQQGLIFSVDRLPALGPQRTYQLWVIPAAAGAAPVSAVVFSVDPAGSATLAVPLPTGITTIAAVAVSEEPAGGSPGPTSTPLLVGAAVNN